MLLGASAQERETVPLSAPRYGPRLSFRRKSSRPAEGLVNIIKSAPQEIPKNDIGEVPIVEPEDFTTLESQKLSNPQTATR